ncbi:MAG TPA: hypothetical protein VIM69_03700 [Opitutaceae bacterium]
MSHSRRADSIEQNATRTHEYNFAPADVLAQTSLSVVIGGESCSTGIARYRYRPHPSGAEKEVKYINFSFWEDAIHDDHLTSVTFGYSVWGDSAIQTLWNLFFL